MRFRTLLIINAAIALGYAIGLLVVPATMLSIYGITQGSAEILMARFFGVALTAIGLLTWLARDVTAADALRAIAIALLISDVVGATVSAQGTLSGVMSAVGWSAFGLYVLLGLGYAYFLFVKRSEVAPDFAAR
ncbi:MAG: hypothetical protein V3U32_03270 [Anaerolineales bacterium]